MSTIALTTAAARALNEVRSIGQARAALRAADEAIDIGLRAADGLSPFSVPTPEGAKAHLNVLRAALKGEHNLIAPMAADSPVDPTQWPRTRRFIERVYHELAGIEGVLGSLASMDLGQILLDSVLAAPRVFGEAIGQGLNTVGRAAGTVGGGLLGGLGPWGVVLLGVLVFLAIKR